jgi:hypothetical protein
MTARNALTPGEHLQPAAGPAWVGGTISGFGTAAANLVSGIRSGDIRLDVTDTEAWLRRFDELVEAVNKQRRELRRAALHTASDTSLGTFELSEQIRAKLADRLGGDKGSFAVALDEVHGGLKDAHVALREALSAHVASDEAGADTLNEVRGGTQLG